MKKIITVTVYQNDVDAYAITPLVKFVDWLSELLESIPAENRDSAKVSFRDTKHGYEHTETVFFRISYDRLETEEEMIARHALEFERKKQQEINDRYLLAKLKEKYEK